MNEFLNDVADIWAGLFKMYPVLAPASIISTILLLIALILI